MDTDDFETTSKRLQKATLIHSDFQPVIEKAVKGNFLFIDPPYTVQHNYNGFVKYNEKIFSWQDQERLKDCVVAAKKRGVRFIVTNADHESIHKLYKGVGKMVALDRHSVLAGTAEHRKASTELVIMGNND